MHDVDADAAVVDVVRGASDAASDRTPRGRLKRGRMSDAATETSDARASAENERTQSGPGTMASRVMAEDVGGVSERSMAWMSDEDDRAMVRCAMEASAERARRASSRTVGARISIGEKMAPREGWDARRRVDLEFWGVPETAREALARKGVRELYPWQAECLALPGVLDGSSNLLYSAPTSGGKSLVADVLLMRRFREKPGSIAMMVLPFVALCEERADSLENLLAGSEVRVRRMFGGRGGTVPSDSSASTLLVLTPERANQVTSRLLEENRLRELSVVIVDELHLIQDNDRGATMELFLTKLVFSSGLWRRKLSEENDARGSVDGESQTTYSVGRTRGGVRDQRTTQILGMSASIPNLTSLAEWLSARLFVTDFRPVRLEVCVKSGHEVFDPQSKRVIRTMTNKSPNSDVAHIAELAQETVDEQGSVLVFCSSRRACKILADDLQSMMRCDPSCNGVNVTSLGELLTSFVAFLGEKSEVLGYIKSGIAYHHAGLSREENEAVAGAYKRGLIRVLCCTSTLATGVNLPARRVILRDTNMGWKKLTARDVQQMCGRAGRAGLDASGSAIVFCQKRADLENVFDLVSGPSEELTSAVAEIGMRRIMLEAVASGLVKTPEDVLAYVKCTLLSALNDFNDAVKQIAIDALQWCQRNALLVWSTTTYLWNSSPLGTAVAGGMMPLDQIQPIVRDIRIAREDLVLSTPLHLLFLLTSPPVLDSDGAPLNVRETWPLDRFAAVWSNLSSEQERIARKVEIDEGYIQRLRVNKRDITNAHKLQRITCQRFHLALALTDLIQEVPIDVIAQKYGLRTFDIAEEQKACARFASYVATICGTLGMGDMEFLINKISDRITAGAQEEILELTKIPHIGIHRARALYAGGITNPKSIVTLGSVDKIAAVLRQYSKNDASTAAAIVRAAREILLYARDIVAEQAREEREQAEARLAEIGEIEADMAFDEPINATELDVHRATGAVLLDTPENVTSFLRAWEISEEYSVMFQPRSDIDASGPRRAFDEPVRIAVALNAKSVFIAKLLYPRHDERDQLARREIAGVRIDQALAILSREGPKKFTINLQAQLCNIVGDQEATYSARLFSFAPPCVDVRIAAWLLRPSAPEVQSSSRDDLVHGMDPTEPLMSLFSAELDSAKSGVDAACLLLERKGRSYEHLKPLSRAVASCFLMGRFLWEECEAKDLIRALIRVEMPFVAPIVAMETVKVPFDPRRLKEEIAAMDDRLKKLEEYAKKQKWLDPLHPANLRRAFTDNAYLVKCLYEHLKLTPPAGSELAFTKTGKQRKGVYSIDQDNLREVHEQSGHMFPLLILEHRSVFKRLTFADVLLGMYGESMDSRIRYSIHQTNHDCGRLTHIEPNFHSMAHDMKCVDAFDGLDAPVISVRSAFTPPADRVFLRVDYSHLELRVMAHFSGDQTLIALLQNPEPVNAHDDPFTMLACKWRGVPLNAVSADERQRVKNLVYGILYGSGVKRLARELRLSDEKAKILVDELKSMLPTLMNWRDDVVARAIEEKPIPRVTTISSRHRYFPELLSRSGDERSAAERQAVNTVCQGSAADIFKTAVVLVMETLRAKHLLDRCQLVLTVHDEAVFEVNASVAKAAARIVRNTMESVAGVFNLSVPLPVKAQIGPSLGDAAFASVPRASASSRQPTPAPSPVKLPTHSR